MMAGRLFAVRVVTAAVILLALLVGSSSALAGGASPRRGALHITKECSQYTGEAGSFCTITSSSLNAIKPGSKIVYASPMLADTVIYHSRVVIDGPGNNTAFGHVRIDVTIPPGPAVIGYIAFSGGTGVFTHFHAGPLAVRCSTLIDCTWDGPYNFSPH